MRDTGSTGALTPYICVHDAAAAIDWYHYVFDAVELVRYVGDDGRIGHGELGVGDAMLMIADEYPEVGVVSARTIGATSVTLNLQVPDVDAVWERALVNGADAERPPETQPYGHRSCVFADPFGHRWMVQTKVSTDEVSTDEVSTDGVSTDGVSTTDDVGAPAGEQQPAAERSHEDGTTMRPVDLSHTYLHLERGPGLRVLDVDENFWATIDERTDLDDGRLVMATQVTADWTSWEMHPDGDEVILVAEGVVRVHTDPGEPVVVQAPELVVMPRGTWHTIDVIEPARVVTITWGAGTQHRAR